MKKVPARLHVVRADANPAAVVFRRGPSKQVCTFLWNRKTDEFTLGQWLKGRIYERRSDLSPDGRFLIYFAMNGKWDSETGGSWTAVSKAPWLKAIELYAKGDCWEGGGLFLSNNAFWLNDRYFVDKKTLQTSKDVKRKKGYLPNQTYGAEDTGVYYVRLQRDGWKLIEHTGSKLDSATVFEKPLPNDHVLRKIAHEQVGSPPGKGCYWDEHELISPDGTVKPLPDWEWAELDGERVTWAEGGCLMHAPFKKGLGKAAVLHDFNGYKFEPIPAPY